MVQANYEKGSVADVAAWAEAGTNARHRQLVQTPIRIHATEITMEKWLSIEAEAERVVQQVLELVNKSSWHLFWYYRKNFWHRSAAVSLRKPQAPMFWGDVENKRTPSREFFKEQGGRWLHYAVSSLRFYGATLPQRLHHVWVVALFILITLPFRLRVLVSRFLVVAQAAFVWFFGASPNVRPWHWRWSYEREVVRPFLASIDALEGRILHLLVDRDDVPLNLNAPKRYVSVQRTEVFLATFGSPDNAIHTAELFDAVIWRAPRAKLDYAVLAAIDRVLRLGGFLIIIVPAHGEMCKEDEIGTMLPHFKVVKKYHLGSIGTALIMRAYIWLQGKLPISLRRGTQLRWIAARLVMAPLMLMAYPVASMAACILNLFGRSDRIYAENVISLEKTGDPALGATCPTTSTSYESTIGNIDRTLAN
jgi:hypothetical protein